MRLFDRFSEWKAAQYDKRIEKNRVHGTCPECRGQGFDPIILNEFTYFGSYDDYKCPGCDGSGRFADWEQSSQLR